MKSVAHQNVKDEIMNTNFLADKIETEIKEAKAKRSQAYTPSRDLDKKMKNDVNDLFE